MTKLTRTLIASFIVLGSAGIANASDNTFITTVKIEITDSAKETYKSLEKQAQLACRREAARSGYPMGRMPVALKRQCEAEILAGAVKNIDNRMLTALHNENTGVETQPRLYAKK